MEVVGWIVWTLLAIFTTILIIAWLVKKQSYKKGRLYDSGEVVALISLPKCIITSIILLVVFVLVDVNKLHLIWIWPIICFFVNLRMAKQVLKADEKRLNEQIEEETKNR